MDCEDPLCENTWDCLTGGQEGGQETCPEGLGYEGCCAGSVLTWCENDAVTTIECQTGCGVWNAEQNFYDCFQEGQTEPSADPSGAFPVECPDFGEGGETAEEGGETTTEEGGETAEEGGETTTEEGGEAAEEGGEATTEEGGEAAEEGGEATTEEGGEAAEEGGEAAEEGGEAAEEGGEAAEEGGETDGGNG